MCGDAGSEGDHDKDQNGSKQCFPRNDEVRDTKQKASDGGEGKDHDQVVDGDLDEGVVGIALGEMAPNEDHRGTGSDAEQDHPCDDLGGFFGGDKADKKGFEEDDTEGSHCEGFDQPIDNEGEDQPFGFAPDIFDAGEIDFEHHGIDHQPDQRSNEKIDAGNLPHRNALECLRREKSKPYADSDGKSNPQREETFKKTHLWTPFEDFWVQRVTSKQSIACVEVTTLSVNTSFSTKPANRRKEEKPSRRKSEVTTTVKGVGRKDGVLCWGSCVEKDLGYCVTRCFLVSFVFCRSLGEKNAVAFGVKTAHPRKNSSPFASRIILVIPKRSALEKMTQPQRRWTMLKKVVQNFTKSNTNSSTPTQNTAPPPQAPTQPLSTHPTTPAQVTHQESTSSPTPSSQRNQNVNRLFGKDPKVPSAPPQGSPLPSESLKKSDLLTASPHALTSPKQDASPPQKTVNLPVNPALAALAQITTSNPLSQVSSRLVSPSNSTTSPNPTSPQVKTSEKPEPPPQSAKPKATTSTQAKAPNSSRPEPPPQSAKPKATTSPQVKTSEKPEPPPQSTKPKATTSTQVKTPENPRPTLPPRAAKPTTAIQEISTPFVLTGSPSTERRELEALVNEVARGGTEQTFDTIYTLYCKADNPFQGNTNENYKQQVESLENPGKASVSPAKDFEKKGSGYTQFTLAGSRIVEETKERVYIHAKADHAPAIMQHILKEQMNGQNEGITAAKIWNYGEIVKRNDGIVVYTKGGESTNQVMASLQAYKTSNPTHFGSTTPMMTHKHSSGIATGDDPIDPWTQGSFGEVRVNAIHTALQSPEVLDTHGQIDPTKLQQKTDELLLKAGVDPANPSRNLPLE